MLTLREWLQLVGLKAHNPFADKQADHEREWLESVFVEHPAFNAMASEAEPRSSILHAERGAGKTSTCTMFERLCAEEAPYRQPVIVRFDEWLPLIDLIDQPPYTQMSRLLTALSEQIVAALAGMCDASWLSPPADPSLHQYLVWFCDQYGSRLTDRELEHLTRFSRLLRSPSGLPDVNLTRLTGRNPFSQLHLLLRGLRASGVKTVYVLVDRIDELALTVADPECGADLLLPLLGNLELLELEGLVIKCFIPTEIVAVLRSRRQLRDDRIPCYDLSWHNPDAVVLLRRLLQNRLTHFSQGAVESLAALANSELRDLDDLLSVAAQGSPRRLLVLCEQLLLARVADATVEDLLIQRQHVDAVLAAHPSLGRASPLQPSAQTGAPAAAATGAQRYPVGRVPTESGASWRPATGTAEWRQPSAAVPLLTLERDGRIVRGDAAIEGWQRLPTRQRELLNYLYSRADQLCHYEELGRAIWHDETISDNTVRKVVDRLSEFLHRGLRVRPDPPYIEKVIGGRYILRHTVALAGSHEPDAGAQARQ